MGSFWDHFTDAIKGGRGDTVYHPDMGTQNIEDVGVADLVENGSNQIDDVYKGMFSEEDRIFLDALMDNTPILGEIRNVNEQIRKTNDFLENTGISYDDIAYKTAWNSGLSGSLEHLYQGVVGRASRGSKNVHNVYSE